MNKKKFGFLLLVVFMVPLAGELKFYPVEGNFRVSFGTPLFFFFLLWRRSLHQYTIILSVSLSVVLFRVGLEVGGGEMEALEAFMRHFPVFFYYLTYGLLFQFLNVPTFYSKPLIVGLCGVVLEVMASMAEMVIRSGVAEQAVGFDLWLLLQVAIIRSFFVLGFFNILLYRQAKIEEEQHKKQSEHMMMVVSGLYAEAIHLTKSMKDAETVTKESYDLYRKIRNLSVEESASSLLGISSRVHEIKKDNQRIYAGLSQVISRESEASYLPIERIGEIVKQANEKYAELLGKQVAFKVTCKGDHPAYPTYALLSILNNLISNAVEAIEEEGNIELTVKKPDDLVEIIVTDNGRGVPDRMRDIIFKHGYTSKFDSSGEASTGIGLSYVQEVVEGMNGSINLVDEEGKTSFLIRLPQENLVEMGQ